MKILITGVNGFIGTHLTEAVLDCTDWEIMGFDIADLLRSDAAYFSRGWEQSKGCRLEHAAAEIYGLKIYYALDRIPEAE